MQARMALQLGDIDRARTLAKRVLARDRDHLGALEVLASAQWRAGECDEVLRTTSRLIQLNPYEPGYFALKGSALQSLGRYGEAAQCLARATELPDMADALRELESWQATLIRELLRSDPVFKAAYAQDPESCCARHGFVFASSGKGIQWLPSESATVAGHTRPS
jgi:tetratricopeptide (TPR) repeat protein